MIEIVSAYNRVYYNSGGTKLLLEYPSAQKDMGRTVATALSGARQVLG